MYRPGPHQHRRHLTKEDSSRDSRPVAGIEIDRRHTLRGISQSIQNKHRAGCSRRLLATRRRRRWRRRGRRRGGHRRRRCRGDIRAPCGSPSSPYLSACAWRAPARSASVSMAGFRAAARLSRQVVVRRRIRAAAASTRRWAWRRRWAPGSAAASGAPAASASARSEGELSRAPAGGGGARGGDRGGDGAREARRGRAGRAGACATRRRARLDVDGGGAAERKERIHRRAKVSLPPLAARGGSGRSGCAGRATAPERCRRRGAPPLPRAGATLLRKSAAPPPGGPPAGARAASRATGPSVRVVPAVAYAAAAAGRIPSAVPGRTCCMCRQPARAAPPPPILRRRRLLRAAVDCAAAQPLAREGDDAGPRARRRRRARRRMSSADAGVSPVVGALFARRASRSRARRRRPCAARG